MPTIPSEATEPLRSDYRAVTFPADQMGPGNAETMLHSLQCDTRFTRVYLGYHVQTLTTINTQKPNPHTRKRLVVVIFILWSLFLSCGRCFYVVVVVFILLFLSTKEQTAMRNQAFNLVTYTTHPRFRCRDPSL